MKFVPIFYPNGAPGYYWPESPGAGDDFVLSPVLEPFAPVKEQMLLLGNVENYSWGATADNPNYLQPSHSRLTGGYLTCVDADRLRSASGNEQTARNGISVDQVLAAHRAGDSPLESLQVGLSVVESSCDGRDCAYSRSISWKTETEPLDKVVDPAKVFDLLVAAEGGVTSATTWRTSVLDAVRESAETTRSRLSRADQLRFDEYLESVRSTEQRIASGVCGNMARPAVIEPTADGFFETYDPEQHCDIMNDLVALALQCGVTEVISYMLEDARSEASAQHVQWREFTQAGSTPTESTVDGQYVSLLHSGEFHDGYNSLGYWFSRKVSELAERLAAIPDGEGTLLDSTVISFGSSLSGPSHDAARLPLVLIGGRGVLQQDRYIDFPEPVSLRDVWFTLLSHAFDVPVESFGESLSGAPNRVLDEILV